MKAGVSCQSDMLYKVIEACCKHISTTSILGPCNTSHKSGESFV